MIGLSLGRSYTIGLILLSEPYATTFLDRCQWQLPFSPDIIIIETHTGESCLISFRYYDQIGRLARWEGQNYYIQETAKRYR